MQTPLNASNQTGPDPLYLEEPDCIVKPSSFFTDHKIKITQKLIKKYTKRVSKIFVEKTISTTLFNSPKLIKKTIFL